MKWWSGPSRWPTGTGSPVVPIDRYHALVVTPLIPSEHRIAQEVLGSSGIRSPECHEWSTDASGAPLIRVCLNRICFRRKLKREPCFCTEILSQIVIWHKKDDVTKKNRLSHVTSCLEIVTKKVCLFEVQILDRKHVLAKNQTHYRFLQQGLQFWPWPFRIRRLSCPLTGGKILISRTF